MPELISVYGYLRVSSDMQVTQWNWLNGQKWAIEDFADKHWYYIEKFYRDEWVSWKLASRKWLDEMLRDLKKANKNKNNPTIKHIIVDDIDRVARDMKIWLDKSEEIKATGATIISLKQTVDDTPEGRLSTGVTMLTKQYERENNARRVVSRQKERLRDWYWCFSVPLWYKFEKDKQWWWKIIVPEEPAFSAMSEWLKLLANWTLPTLQSLVDYLNDREIVSKRWCRILKSFASRLMEPTLLCIYAWYITFRQWDIEMVKARHQPAITLEEFYKITNKYKVKWFYKEYSKNEISEKLPLRQVIRCSRCWWLLTWSTTKWNGGKYFYYFCAHRGCPYCRRSYNSDQIHKELETFLWGLTLNDAFMDCFKEVIDAVWKEKWAVEQNEKIAIERRIKKINSGVDLLVDKMAETQSDIIYNKFEEKITKLEEEKQLLQARLSSSESSTLEDYMEKYDVLKAIMQNPIKIWKQSDIELKRLLISVIFDRTLSYSFKTGIQTKEIPLIYAEKLALDKQSPEIKNPHHTNRSKSRWEPSLLNSQLYFTGNRTRTCTPNGTWF